MLTTINLDYQPFIKADKVHNVIANNLLSSEFYSLQLSAFKKKPESLFGQCWGIS
jgi:hypothetical protein